MPQLLVYFLLALALVVPVLGALLLRLLGKRLTERTFIVVAVVLFGMAMTSTLVLANSDVSSLRVGNLTLLLPNRSNADVAAAAAANAGPPADGTTPVLVPSEAPTAENTAAPSATVVAPTTAASPAATATTGTAQTATNEPSATAAATVSPTQAVSATAEPTATAAAAGAERRYTVRSGDTLSQIAERFGVSTAAIIRANNLTQRQAENLQIGQELVIPAAATATPASAGPSPTPASSQRTYTVRSGDTLGAIAQRFNVSVAAIREANNLTVAQGNNLRIGQVLIIPEP